MRSKPWFSSIWVNPSLTRRRLTALLCGGAVLFSAAAEAAIEKDSSAPATLTAPITAVTVYSDRARVIRSAKLVLDGGALRRVDLPLLGPSVDMSSIRVDTRGANVDVQRVEITYVSGSELPESEAQQLLSSLEQVDDKLTELNEENSAVQTQLDLLGRLVPVTPPMPNNGGKSPLINSGGWGGVYTFLRGTQEKLQAKQADIAEKQRGLVQKRQKLVTQVQLSVGSLQRGGYRVTPTLRGQGPVDLWVSYMTPNARWFPTYDIQLIPGKNQVELSFSGRVSQTTGEDWTDVALMLSTAVPATATQVPRLLTWKLGTRDRFIPTPPQISEPPLPPPLSPPPPPVTISSAEQLRQRLIARIGRFRDEGAADAPKKKSGALGGELRQDISRRQAKLEEIDRDGDGLLDSVDKDDKKSEYRDPPPAPPPPPESTAQPVQVSAAPMMHVASESARSVDTLAASAPGSYAFDGEERESSRSFESARRGPVVGIGIAPPPGYRPPPQQSGSPAALAGGYDLSYASLYKESIGSGKGARRVALFTRSFPVGVQRKVFAAIAPEAYLVAEINNPSQQPLPGGQAHLFVGADPAGVAMLKLVAPGEAFTLPLGLDRAVKPVRNVKMSTVEKGVFSKDEITEYVVTTELMNPYREAIDVRLLDQLPLNGDKNVEIKLVRSEPAATQDINTGGLQWRLMIPPGQKIETRFIYTLRRPKGARLSQ